MNATTATPRPQVDWAQVASDLAPIRCDRTANTIKRKSRDYYWFSPILKTKLEDVRADLLVTIESVAELERVVRYCVANRLPLTIRGAGTGNYGQAMPLRGGVLLDVTRLDQLLWVKDGIVRVEAGIKMYDLGKAVAEHGYELRFFPSTWKSATLGGFVAGGSSGCGAINYGTLHSDGNILGLKVLTTEAEPRIVELRGDDVQAVIHAYGTTGIILEVEMALATARRWHDRIVALPDLAATLKLADALANSDAIGKKQLTVYDENTAAAVKPVADLSDAPSPVLLLMIDEATLPAFDALVAEHGGRVIFERDPETRPGKMPPLYEMCWNHTTLQAITRDPGISYLQCAFPDDYVPAVEAVYAELGAEMPIHLELARLDGKLVCFGIPLLRYTSEARLSEIHAVLRKHGCTVFNPHTYLLENGGMQIADPAQLAFRQVADPLGLLNPGKMPGWDAPSVSTPN